MKLDKSCPNIQIRRSPKSNDYNVRVNGRNAYLLHGDGEWSRRIFVEDKAKVVIKIDNDLEQSRNEAVLWSEHIEDADKKYFAKVLGLGTTSIYRKYQGGKIGRVFYIVQSKIDYDDKEYDNWEFLTTHERSVIKEIVNKYRISDFADRQTKRDRKGNVKLHDYGLWGDRGMPVHSESIPTSARYFARKIADTKKIKVVA